MKTWLGIGVVIGVSLIIGLGSIFYRNLSADFADDTTFLLTSDLARRGMDVATGRGCIACHTLNGQKGIGPTWRGMYGRTVTFTDGSSIVVNGNYIRESILDPGARVVADFDNIMLRPQPPLSDLELNALVEFTRQLGEP